MSLYLEDDDELRKMRERFMQSEPGGAAMSGNPYGAPPRELDPSTVQSFLAQKQEPRDYAYPIPQREQGLGVADWFPLAAAGLDLAFNKGRGMGGIAQSAANMAQHRDALAQQQFQDDRRAYLAQGEAGARDRQLDLQGRNADMRQQELDASLAKERAIQARFLAGEGSPEARAADLRYKQALAARAEAEAARDPHAITPYQQAQLDEMKSQHRIQAEDRDLDRQQRKELAELTKEQTKTLKQTQAEAQADKRKQDVVRQYNKDTEKFVPIASTMRDVDNVIGKLRGSDPNADIPGIGATGLVPFTLLSPEGKIIRSAKENMADDLLRIKSGTAAPPAETAKIEKALSPGATDADFMVGYQAWRNIVQGQMKRFGVGREDMARESLRAADLEDWLYGKAVPPPEAAAAPAAEPAVFRAGNGKRQAAGYDPLTNGLVNPGDPETVVDTGGRRDVPPLPADAVKKHYERLGVTWQ